tara:strand:- start:1178 stop:1549 length:372 start_codon:yes stop_codon:yes gene_type:complete
MKNLTPEQRKEIEQDALYQIRTQFDLSDLDHPLGVHLMERTEAADIVQVTSAMPPAGNVRGPFRFFAIDRDEMGTASRVYRSRIAAENVSTTAAMNTNKIHVARPLGQFYQIQLATEANNVVA